MDYVFIDTSVFEANNFLESNRIREILKLAKEGKIKIVLPEITYNEILNRARKNFEEAIKGFNKYRNNTRILRNVPSLIPKFEPIDETACLKELTDGIKSALGEAGIEIIAYPTIGTKELFESYFEKKKPFGSGIKKDEFPDAIALISMEQWCAEHHRKCIVLAKDKDLIEYESEALSHQPFEDYLDAKLKSIELEKKQQARLKKIDFMYMDGRPKFEEKIKEWLFGELDDDSKYLKAINYLEVHDIDIQEYEAELLGYQITSVSDTAIELEGEVNIWYTVEIETDDENSGYYDDEDKVWYYFNTKTEKIEEDEKITVSYRYEIPAAGEDFAELDIVEINDGKELDI